MCVCVCVCVCVCMFWLDALWQDDVVKTWELTTLLIINELSCLLILNGLELINIRWWQRDQLSNQIPSTEHERDHSLCEATYSLPAVKWPASCCLINLWSVSSLHMKEINKMVLRWILSLKLWLQQQDGNCWTCLRCKPCVSVESEEQIQVPNWIKLNHKDAADFLSDINKKQTQEKQRQIKYPSAPLSASSLHLRVSIYTYDLFPFTWTTLSYYSHNYCAAASRRCLHICQ